jgi:outer membrane immunogenic protein
LLQASAADTFFQASVSHGGAHVKLLKPLLSSTVFSALAAAPALAQAPLFNWSGFYVGANIGGAWGKNSFDETLTGGGWWVTSASADASGVIGGLLAGQNWQAGNIVYGWEADISLSSAKERTLVFPPVPTVTYESKLTALGTLRGRVGVATDRTLFFITGGGAYGRLKNEIVDPTFVGVVRRDSSAWGWVAGGGIEHAFAHNWTARVEFLHARLGSDTQSVTGPSYTFRFKDSVSIARAGINYRF